jgi:acyl-CoA synthetase (AMP-forming)/AMP-acid ligase II
MHRTLARTLEALPSHIVHPAVWTPEGAVDWPELQKMFGHGVKELQWIAGARVGLAFGADAQGLATLAALEQLGCDVFLFDADLPNETRAAWRQQFQLAAVLPASSQGSDGGASDPKLGVEDTRAGSATILTSGTTGEPKAVRHTWQSLARPVREVPGGETQCWLLAFRPHLYAGLQVILQSLLNYGTLVAPRSDNTPDQLAALMIRTQVQFASATPSYWRRLLMALSADTLQQIPLQQITLGGEVVDQPLLDQLAALFPAARLVHIYATTELGRCFAVGDGRAGFPRSLLEHPTPEGVEIKIQDGQLWVRSANAMQGYDAILSASTNAADDAGQAASKQWVATGDLVEERADRVFFVGRNSDLINVGGNKIAPLAVESVIRELVEVAEVRVYGQASSIAGQLVACQVVARGAISEHDLRQRIREHCLQRLDRLQCPRIIQVVNRIELTNAGKLSRPK